MEAPQFLRPPSSIAPPRPSSSLLSPSSPQEPPYIMTTMPPQRIGMDRLHELQCQASEQLVGGASEDMLSDAIAAWGSILRQILPHIIGGGAAAKDDGASTSTTTSSATNNMAMWVAPVSPSPHDPTSHDDAAADTTTTIFTLFPYVLVYTAVAPSASASLGSAAHGCCLVPGSSDARRVGAGVAYNLALAYHLQSLQQYGHGGQQQQRRQQQQQQQPSSSANWNNSAAPTSTSTADNYYASLRTALGAYKAARDLLVSAVATSSSAHQEDDDLSFHWRQRLTEDDRLLLLAITNNEGHINELLHERNRVVEALDGLRMGLEGVANPAGICGHFTITDALFGDRSVVHNMHSAAA